MERLNNAVPFEIFKTLQGHREQKRTQPITAAREAAANLLQDANTRFQDISEDSYASRNEARKRIDFLARLNRKVARAKPGGTVDLTKRIVDYGYDPEAAASDQSCGLEYVPEADQAERDYDINIGSVSHVITQLEKAGVSVKVGVRRVAPEWEWEL